MAASLESVPAGSDVFVDANVFFYGIGKQSRQCESFLERCSREEVYGFTSFDVVADVTHKLMITEAFSLGLIRHRRASNLKESPEVVRRLAHYWTNTCRVLDLNFAIVAVDDAVTDGAQKERDQAGLLTRDSLIVACMRSLGLRCLASADRDFDRVEGIVAYGPTDL